MQKTTSGVRRLFLPLAANNPGSSLVITYADCGTIILVEPSALSWKNIHKA